jgi:hypothetical protein
MSGVREAGMEAVEESRSGAPSGEPEASREERWRARRKEPWRRFGRTSNEQWLI